MVAQDELKDVVVPGEEPEEVETMVEEAQEGVPDVEKAGAEAGVHKEEEAQVVVQSTIPVEYTFFNI